MSVALSDVKRRIGVTRQIRKVCGTLQKVAAARLARDLKSLGQSELYFERVCNVLGQVRGMLPLDADVHPLMQSREGGLRCIAVLGADRGLCGSFNSGLLGELSGLLDPAAGDGVVVLASGRVIQRRVGRLSHVASVPVDGIDALELLVMDGFLSGQYRSVELVHWHYVSSGRQTLRVVPLLPCAGDAFGKSTPSAVGGPLVEPGASAVLDRMLPAYVRARLRSCFHHSSVSENAQRQLSMSRATENAGEMLDSLTKSYRRLRQESITTEMLELISGMEPKGRSRDGNRASV